MPISDVIEYYGVPFYMKIDIEGYESKCISTIKKNNKPKYISTEIDKNIKVAIQLQRLGYTKFKLVNQEDNIPYGSSGEFGEDAIDFEDGRKWCNYLELLNKIKKLSNQAWFDIHATYDKEINNYSKAKLLYLEFKTRYKTLIGFVGDNLRLDRVKMIVNKIIKGEMVKMKQKNNLMNYL